MAKKESSWTLPFTSRDVCYFLRCHWFISLILVISSSLLWGHTYYYFCILNYLCSQFHGSDGHVENLIYIYTHRKKNKTLQLSTYLWSKEIITGSESPWNFRNDLVARLRKVHISLVSLVTKNSCLSSMSCFSSEWKNQSINKHQHVKYKSKIRVKYLEDVRDERVITRGCDGARFNA